MFLKAENCLAMRHLLSHSAIVMKWQALARSLTKLLCMQIHGPHHKMRKLAIFPQHLLRTGIVEHSQVKIIIIINLKMSALGCIHRCCSANGKVSVSGIGWKAIASNSPSPCSPTLYTYSCRSKAH